MPKTAKPQQKKSADPVIEKTLEERFDDLQRLGKCLREGSRDNHQVFIWYAYTKKKFGVRISNATAFRGYGSTIDEALTESEVKTVLVAEDKAHQKFGSVLEALDWFETYGSKTKQLLKQIDEHTSAINELRKQVEELSLMGNKKK